MLPCIDIDTGLGKIRNAGEGVVEVGCGFWVSHGARTHVQEAKRRIAVAVAVGRAGNGWLSESGHVLSKEVWKVFELGEEQNWNAGEGVVKEFGLKLACRDVDVLA